MGQLPELLVRFRTEVLPCFILPSLSQKVVTLMCDRDAGAEQLVASTRGNPAAPAWLALEWERKTGTVQDQVREVDYWVPRLGIERCRKVWISSQLRALWGVDTELDRARKISERVELWRVERPERDPSLGDSAFLGGLLFDLLWIAVNRQQKLASTASLVFEARFRRFEQGLLAMFEDLETQKSFLSKRWVVAIAAAAAVSELWLQIEDPDLAAKVLRWEARGIPLELRRLLMRKALGFSPKVMAAWIADLFPTLRPYREVLRCCETPGVFAADKKEAHQLAIYLSGSSEVG